MSHPESDAIVVAGDDLTVSKRLDSERFEHIGLVYEIRSDRATPVHIRLSDTVPESIPVGFHPQFYGSDWSMDDRTVVFERTLDPGEELTTLYGLGTGADDSPDRFRTEPTVEYRPTDDDEYIQLEPAPESSAQPDRRDGTVDAGTSSISELASSLETMDLETEPEGLDQSGEDPNRSAKQRIRSSTRDDFSALRDAIDELEAIVEGLPADPAERIESEAERQAAGFHIEAILFHIAHLREDLSGWEFPSEPDTGSEDIDGDASPGDAEETQSSEPPEPTATGTSDEPVEEPGVIEERSLVQRIGRGIPYFWIIAVIGVALAITALGFLPRIGRDLVLAGTGGVMSIVGAFGWLYPEENLPLSVMLLIVVLGGLGIVIYPFLFGEPNSLSGNATIAAGVLIVTIPMVVETRRGQLVGKLRNRV